MPTTEIKTQSQDLTLNTLLDATGDLDSAEALQKNLPAFLLKCSATQLAAIDRTTRELHAVQLTVEKELATLKPLHSFCIDELTVALRQKWAVDFDVEKDFLSLPGADCGCEPISTDENGVKTFPAATQTLLQAAMQNFTEEEAAGGFPVGSQVVVQSTPGGVSGLTVAAFAGLCRELDLGKRYQAHFQQVFGPLEGDDKAVVRNAMVHDIASMKKLLLQLDTQLAAIKNHITPAGLQTVQRLIDAEGVVSAATLLYNKQTLMMQGLEIFDSCVWGVVVFCAHSFESHPQEPCLVYMAGEPERALYEYPSFNAFKQYLTQKLKDRRYKDYFANSIDEDDKADFFKAVADSAELGSIKSLPITVPLFEFMVQSHVGKMQVDARKLAVPTADIDDDARRKRLLDFLQLGVTVASVAGFFVPVLGQLMMGVAVGQLLGEVYEGIEDWQRGDQQEALSHLLSVAENIALMGVFAGGQKVVGTLGRHLVRSHPAFFGQFTAIYNQAGKPRLWKPDLSPYEHDLPRGFTLAEGTEELHQIGSTEYGRVGHRILAGTFDSTSRTWRLQHPGRPEAFSPVLERHVEGGWRTPAEDTEQWRSAAYTLKRIDPQLCDFTDAELDMMRRISGDRYEALQRALHDNLPLSSRLRDSVERLRTERRLRVLIAELERGETHSGQPVHEQLRALSKLPGWPTDRYIAVTDAAGEVTATYPLTTVRDDRLSVVITEDQLAEGQLLQTVIDGLYQKEVDALLGGNPGRQNEREILAKKLGSRLKADRPAVFQRMYERYDRIEADDVQKLRNTFVELPARHAQRLIDQAPSVERLHLRSSGRVPVGLAQKVRAATHQVRVDRALIGLHLPAMANPDTEKLAIQLLPRLSGWDAQLRLEVREKNLKGPLLEAIGVAPATPLNTRTLVKSNGGYEVFDGDSKSLGRVEAGADERYQAILKALTPAQRAAAGFPDPVPADGARLRNKLLETALDEREVTARMLISGKSEPVVFEPACVQADQVMTTTHPRALLRKVLRLFPSYTEAQASQLIDQLGNDPLTRATGVKALREDLRSLRDALELWSEDEPAIRALGGDGQEVRHSRKATAELIEDSFRRLLWVRDANGQPVCTLNLDGMRVGKLPTLPPGLKFDHIKRLSLRNMEQGDDIAYFLRSFKQVETLELDRNKLTRLPEILSFMPDLGRLSLAGNQIRLTEQTLLKLSQLRTLHSLNLSGNPLGATPDVSHMLKLRSLALRETGATELPKGLARLPDPDWVDLRNNEIKVLPDWLFTTPRRFSEALNLRFNPLSDVSSTYLSNYRENIGVGMGYLDNDNARLDENQARSLWFTDGAGEDWNRRNRIWTAFKDDPRAEGLFHLLAELSHTADSEKATKDMHRRVWAVLEAAEQRAPLYEQILDLAANPINCTDSAAINFSHLEIAVEVDRVISPAEGRVNGAKPLIKLGRGLFRLDQLNQIAQEHADKNPTADPLEVNLAYRTGLADDLDLPGQPRFMRYALLGGVTRADLDIAKNRIITAEASAQWVTFLQRQSFWCDYLKRTFSRQFSNIDETFSPQLDAVFEQASTLSSADYLSQMDAIRFQRELAEEAVLTRLTDDAIRLVNLGICALPQG